MQTIHLYVNDKYYCDKSILDYEAEGFVIYNEGVFAGGFLPALVELKFKVYHINNQWKGYVYNKKIYVDKYNKLCYGIDPNIIKKTFWENIEID